jgi:hypothetical protein
MTALLNFEDTFNVYISFFNEYLYHDDTDPEVIERK